MRILLLVDSYFPRHSAAAQLIRDLAVEFYERNLSVTIVTPDDTIAASTICSYDNTIEIIRVRTGKIKGVPLLIRGYRELGISYILWSKTKAIFLKRHYDLIVYYSPTIFWGPLVKRLKKIFQCRAYLIIRDIFPQWAVDAGVLKRGLFYRIMKLFEKINYDAADVIGVQSPANLQYFYANGIEKKYTLEVLYNWASTKDKGIQYLNFRETLGLDNKVVFFYGGNMGVAQDMDNIIRLAVRLKAERKAHFLLVGDGSEVPRLNREISKYGLTNITIHPSVDQESYLSMLAEFDVGLISLNKNLKTQNFPGKMISYMYSAKPILASINLGNDLKDILQKNEAGLVCNNREDDIFYNYAIQLLNNPSLRHTLGKNGRTLMETTFSVSRVATQILSHFWGNNFPTSNIS